MAVVNACETLVARLQRYRDAGKSWEESVTAATADGVALISPGWYSKFNKTQKYSTYGVAVSEVMIDVLTGEVRRWLTDFDSPSKILVRYDIN